MRITESDSMRPPTSSRMRSALRVVSQSIVSTVQVTTSRPCAAAASWLSGSLTSPYGGRQ